MDPYRCIAENNTLVVEHTSDNKIIIETNCDDIELNAQQASELIRILNIRLQKIK